MFQYIVVACITLLLVPLVQSDRLFRENHGNLRIHTRSSRALKMKRGDDESAGDTGVDETEGNLACVDVRTGRRMIIQAADKLFWDYYLNVGSRQAISNEKFSGPAVAVGADHPTLAAAGFSGDEAPSSLQWKCKAFSRPQSNKAAVLSFLPSDIKETLRSLEPHANLTCSHSCTSVCFGMGDFEECSSATTPAEFKTVKESVREKDGCCRATKEEFLGTTKSLEQCRGIYRHNPMYYDEYGATKYLKRTRCFNRCELTSKEDILKMENEFMEEEKKKRAESQRHIAYMRRNLSIDDVVFAGFEGGAKDLHDATTLGGEQELVEDDEVDDDGTMDDDSEQDEDPEQDAQKTDDLEDEGSPPQEDFDTTVAHSDFRAIQDHL